MEVAPVEVDPAFENKSSLNKSVNRVVLTLLPPALREFELLLEPRERSELELETTEAGGDWGEWGDL
jgi:hypothetical protein